MVALTAATAAMLHGHYDLTILVSVAGDAEDCHRLLNRMLVL